MPSSQFILQKSYIFLEYTFGSDVFVNPIPTEIDWSNVSNDTGNPLPGLTANNVVTSVKTSDVVRKYEKLKLVEVPNSNKQSWYCPGADDVNILSDAISNARKMNPKLGFKK